MTRGRHRKRQDTQLTVAELVLRCDREQQMRDRIRRGLAGARPALPNINTNIQRFVRNLSYGGQMSAIAVAGLAETFDGGGTS